MKYFLILVLFLMCGHVRSQTKTMYVFKDRYNEQTNKFIKNSNIDFREIKILLTYMIDPKKEDVVDYARVEQWLDKLFPNKSDTGVLCVDLENKLYEHLKGNNITRSQKVSRQEYSKATDEFIKLAKFIKQKRPNVKVGFYGMPFKLYHKSEMRWFSRKKLDPILKEVDVLFPSFYIPYPAESKGVDANFAYLKSNLDISLEYGSRLNKSVIPLFWYLVFSPDNKLRFERISKQEMSEYIKYAENYKSSNGTEISGIAWWDTPSPYSGNLIKENFLTKEDRGLKKSMDEVFIYYFNKQ